jgi:hypothetical protein
MYVNTSILPDEVFEMNFSVLITASSVRYCVTLIKKMLKQIALRKGIPLRSL